MIDISVPTIERLFKQQIVELTTRTVLKEIKKR